MAEWKGGELRVADTIRPITVGTSNIVQGIAGVIETGIAILDLLSSFLVVGQNPLLAGVAVLLEEIRTLLQSLSETGVHSLFIVPETPEEILEATGGYGKFEQTFLAALHDLEDPQRPQFSDDSTAGAFFLLLLKDDPSELIPILVQLFSFLARRFEFRYPEPVNVRIKPANQSGVPQERILNVFSDASTALTTLRLEWQEPRIANDIFLDFFGKNKFYIERSKSREGDLRLREATSRSVTNPLESRNTEQGLGQVIDPFIDDDGDPIYYWEPLNPDNPFVEPKNAWNYTLNRINFLSGSYAYIIEDVEPGQESAYYYRVRSVPADTRLEPVNVTILNAQGKVEEKTVYDLKLGDERIHKLCPPSLPVFGFLPDIDLTFDLPSALLNLYRVAYLYRFDARFRLTDGTSASGPDLLDPSISDAFYQRLKDPSAGIHTFSELDTEGNPIESLIYYFPFGLFDSEKEILNYFKTETSWQNFWYADARTFDPFGGVDEFIAPSINLPTSTRMRLEIDRIALKKVKKLVPFLLANDGLRSIFQTLYLNNEDLIKSLLVEGVGSLDFKEDRDTIYQMVQFVNGGSRSGNPPNWESIRLLDEIVPIAKTWTDKIFEFLTALNNTLQNTLADLRRTIRSVQDRLAVITELLDLLDDLILSLDLFAQLLPNFQILWIEPRRGGNTRLVSEFRNAEDKPTSDAGQVYASFVFAFGGPGKGDVDGITNVFKFLFGV
jgi:hypothetical protein